MSTESKRAKETIDEVPKTAGDAQSELTKFQRDALRAVQLIDGATGQSVKDTLEANGYPNVNHGRLYPNLDVLERAGLIEKERLTGRSNAYRITHDGENALVEQIRFLGGSE